MLIAGRLVVAGLLLADVPNSDWRAPALRCPLSTRDVEPRPPPAMPGPVALLRTNTQSTARPLGIRPAC